MLCVYISTNHHCLVEHTKCNLNYVLLYTVSFPKLKPLFRYLFRTVVLGDAMDYLAEASQEIIKSRRALNGESNTVSDTSKFKVYDYNSNYIHIYVHINMIKHS